MKRFAVLALLACTNSAAPAMSSNGREKLDITTTPGIPYFDAIQIGNVRLEATTGTRGPKTRLAIQGLNGAGAELELVPSSDYSGTGVTSQIQLFAKRGDGYARFGLTVMRESDNRDDVIVLDATSSGSRLLMPFEIVMGEGKPSILVNRDGTVVEK